MEAREPRTPDVSPVVSLVLNGRHRVPPARAFLVGISGIDGSGKGHVAARVAEALGREGVKPAILAVDGWLNLPHVRFSAEEPARHFYRHALRLDAMFERLVLPLKAARSAALEADFAEETAAAFRRHVYAYHDVDVILLEGIFLFKREYDAHYDLRVWLDCTFPTALERAVARGQEGLSPDATIAAYERIYFPAQRIHFDRDRPKQAADVVLANDPRLAPWIPGTAATNGPEMNRPRSFDRGRD